MCCGATLVGAAGDTTLAFWCIGVHPLNRDAPEPGAPTAGRQPLPDRRAGRSQLSNASDRRDVEPQRPRIGVREGRSSGSIT
jgi:hypothetical protein